MRRQGAEEQARLGHPQDLADLPQDPGHAPGGGLLEDLGELGVVHHGVTLSAPRGAAGPAPGKNPGFRSIGPAPGGHNRPPAENNTGWNATKTRVRREVNQWIRTKAPFDAVIDFDAVVQDPGNGDLIYPPFNCGDGIHPSPRGYYEMGRSVRLDLFR